MSSSMPISKRKQQQPPPPPPPPTISGSTSSSSSSSSSYGSSSSMMTMSPPSRTPASSSSRKGKNKVPSVTSTASSTPIFPRRPSLMGSSLRKSEYTTVINLHLGRDGDDDRGHGQPRLVTCVKSSQGFCWNQELFLPSYYANEYNGGEFSDILEHRPDPVWEIVLTDEEAAAIMPL